MLSQPFHLLFSSQCFWGSEKGIWRLPKGIYSTAVGYCAGFTPNPTYEEACSGKTGHTEGVRVVYDPTKISFVDILRWFWEAHDPTSGMGQGNDRGTQYRSGFYWMDDEQKQLILASKQAYEKKLEDVTGRPRQISTEMAASTDYDSYGGLWYFAEAYHQQYLGETISKLKAHVDKFILEMDELYKKASMKDLSQNTRLPLIVMHNEFVRETFMRVKEQIDPLYEELTSYR